VKVALALKHRGDRWRPKEPAMAPAAKAALAATALALAAAPPCDSPVVGVAKQQRRS